MSIGNYVAWLGLVVITYKVTSYCLSGLSRVNIKNYSYGWVAITGASDGIGKEFAEWFAVRGFKVILISRDQTKLEKVKQELMESTKNPNIEIIVANFAISHRDPENYYSNLAEKLKQYEISVLVNNVGIFPNIKYLVELKSSDIEQTLGVNIYPQVYLTHKLIPEFLYRYENSKQKSLIINIGSLSSTAPLPTMSIYGATKRFNDFFSQAISFEYSPAIEICSFTPYAVSTALTRRFDPRVSSMFGCISSSEFVSCAMSQLGLRTSGGHWKHNILLKVIECIPSKLLTVLVYRLMAIYIGI
jgi:17beta-estradiol 17-dehydrogenase / very-long-chain 3-oxoacyl-CoA reductase